MQVSDQRIRLHSLHTPSQLQNPLMLISKLLRQLKTQRLMPPNIRLHPLIHPIYPIHLIFLLRVLVILLGYTLQYF